MKRRIVTLFGSFFYTGFFPVAPASFASFIWLLCYLFLPGGRWLVHPASLVITIPAAIYISTVMEKDFGRDAPEIVIDEFVGMQVSLLGVVPSWPAAVAGFILFRFFDIAKLFPANRSQKLPGGYGVVLDDVIAGVYAYIILRLLMRYTGIF